MSTKSPIDISQAPSLSGAWDADAKTAAPAGHTYGNAGQINAMIGHALLDFLSFVYQCDAVRCHYGVIGKRPFEGAFGLHLSSTIEPLNPLMGRNLQAFLGMVAKDADAHDQGVYIFRDFGDEEDKQIIVYADPRKMMDYVYSLYVDAGVQCDFTRQYSRMTEALTPRTRNGGFYLN